MNKTALASTAKRLSDGRAYVHSEQGVCFEGIYERPVDLAQGRFAVIAKSKEFTLVPWRAELEHARGQWMGVKRTVSGIKWTLGKAWGIGR